MKTLNTFLVGSMLAAGFAVTFIGCTAFGPMPHSDTGDAGTMPVADGGSTATSCMPADCSDGNPCTTDRCGTDGECLHFSCGAGQRCAITGCVDDTTPPPSCDGGCDDGYACTVDSCVAGVCRHDPNHGYCGETECDPSHPACNEEGCVIVPPPPIGGFRCLESGLVGDAIRIHPDANGVRSIGANESASGPAQAPRDMSSGSGVILWGLNYGHPLASPSDRDAAGEAHVGAPGAAYDYSIADTTGGGINTMLYTVDADVVFNWSDLRPLEGRPASEIGYWVEARQGSDWVRLPDRFVQIAPDTVGARWYDVREIEPALRGTVAIRVVVYTSGTARCAL